MKFLPSVIPSKDMEDHTRERSKSSTTSGFDCPLLFRLCFENELIADNGGNCSKVNVKGTEECCATSTKNTDDG